MRNLQAKWATEEAKAIEVKGLDQVLTILGEGLIESQAAFDRGIGEMMQRGGPGRNYAAERAAYRAEVDAEVARIAARSRS